jgi:hypothetical protein
MRPDELMRGSRYQHHELNLYNRQGLFPFHHSSFYSHLKSKVGNVLTGTRSHPYVPTLTSMVFRDYNFTHTHSPLPLINFSSLIHFPLLRYPCPRSTLYVRGPPQTLALSHRESLTTPTPLFIYSA